MPMRGERREDMEMEEEWDTEGMEEAQSFTEEKPDELRLCGLCASSVLSVSCLGS